jgi:hypothetical protein
LAFVLAAAVLLPAADVRGQRRRGRRPRRPVDAETAENFDEFREMVMKQTSRMAERMARRCDLDADQQAETRRLIRRHAERFLSRRGPELFEVYRRGRAVAEFMREEQMTWNEVPPDLKLDLFRRGISLMQAGQRRLRRFADDFSQTLDDDQLEKFQAERRRMDGRFRQGLMMARAMEAQAVAEVAGEAPSAPEAGPKPPLRRPGGSGDAYRVDRWERYVRRFIERYRLDEVQKVRAMDLLAKYKRKLGDLRERQQRLPTSRPATRPAAEAASVEEFKARLERHRKLLGGAGRLFEQLKAELDKIPTPVQRRLADEKKPPAGEPDRKPGEPQRKE